MSSNVSLDCYSTGAIPSSVDVRDYKVKSQGSLPEEYFCSTTKVKNQRSVRSCVAHATCTVLEMLNKIETGEEVSLSTDFIYGMQGLAYNRLGSGMYLRDACKIVKDYGDALQSSVKGNTEQPRCTEKLASLLNEDIKKEAYNFHVKSYARCSSDKDIKYALVNYGPVLASIKWYNDYKVNSHGVLKSKNKEDAGYHAFVIYGYTKQGWVCQNSWGASWGFGGRFIYPYSSKLEESWSFVDADNKDIYTPKRNSLFDIFYKLFNSILNKLKS